MALGAEDMGVRIDTSRGPIAAVVFHMGISKIEAETIRPKLKKAKKR